MKQYKTFKTDVYLATQAITGNDNVVMSKDGTIYRYNKNNNILSVKTSSGALLYTPQLPKEIIKKHVCKDGTIKETKFICQLKPFVEKIERII